MSISWPPHYNSMVKNWYLLYASDLPNEKAEPDDNRTERGVSLLWSYCAARGTTWGGVEEEAGGARGRELRELLKLKNGFKVNSKRSVATGRVERRQNRGKVRKDKGCSVMLFPVREKKKRCHVAQVSVIFHVCFSKALWLNRNVDLYSDGQQTVNIVLQLLNCNSPATPGRWPIVWSTEVITSSNEHNFYCITPTLTAKVWNRSISSRRFI